MAGYNTCMNLIATELRHWSSRLRVEAIPSKPSAQKSSLNSESSALSGPSRVAPDYLAEQNDSGSSSSAPTQTLSLDQDGAMKTITCLQELVEEDSCIDNMVPGPSRFQMGITEPLGKWN